MKIRLLFVACLLLLSFAPARAGSDQSYSDFLKNYRSYQNSLSPFNIAKSKYLTYGSVISQGEYLEAARNLIKYEISSINSFTGFLIEYLKEANTNIGLSENIALIKLNDFQGRMLALTERQSLVDSLESAQIVMLEISDSYDEMFRLSYWTKATIESAGVKKTYDNLGVVKPRLYAYIAGLPAIYKENQAAKEKFNSLEVSYNSISEMISVSYDAQKGFENDKTDPGAIEKEVHKEVQKSTNAMYNLILGYQNILFAVKKI